MTCFASPWLTDLLVNLLLGAVAVSAACMGLAFWLNTLQGKDNEPD